MGFDFESAVKMEKANTKNQSSGVAKDKEHFVFTRRTSTKNPHESFSPRKKFVEDFGLKDQNGFNFHVDGQGNVAFEHVNQDEALLWGTPKKGSNKTMRIRTSVLKDALVKAGLIPEEEGDIDVQFVLKPIEDYENFYEVALYEDQEKEEVSTPAYQYDEEAEDGTF